MKEESFIHCLCKNKKSCVHCLCKIRNIWFSKSILILVIFKKYYMIMNRGFYVIALHKCVGGGRSTFIRPNTKQAALVSSQICFSNTLSTVWNERNGRRHSENPNNPARLTKRIDMVVRNRISGMRMMGDQQYVKAMETWFSVR